MGALNDETASVVPWLKMRSPDPTEAWEEDSPLEADSTVLHIVQCPCDGCDIRQIITRGKSLVIDAVLAVGNVEGEWGW